MNDSDIWDGVHIQTNGSISESDAGLVRKRLRILITADVKKLAVVLSQVEELQRHLADFATMEFAVEDLSHPESKP